MNTLTPPLIHDSPDLFGRLDALDDAALDAVDFGVIGFDPESVVRRYNRCESVAAGLAPARVIGHPLFTEIAQCMNNYLVAQRFEDAATRGLPLDVAIDYVLTWRMKPTSVKLRLMSSPDRAMRYIVLHRLP